MILACARGTRHLSQAMQIALRQAGSADFDYCAKLYFAALETTIPDLNPDAQ